MNGSEAVPVPSDIVVEFFNDIAGRTPFTTTTEESKRLPSEWIHPSFAKPLT